MFTAFFTGASAAARDNNVLECNETALFLSFDTEDKVDFFKGRIRNNETCNIAHIKCDAWQFCYYQPTVGTYHKADYTPFCAEQDGANVLDPSLGLSTDVDNTLITSTDSHNRMCNCYDPVHETKEYATGPKNHCAGGKSYYPSCGNTDGTTSNKAQLTDAKWGVQGENTIYMNRNSTSAYEFEVKCSCALDATLNSMDCSLTKDSGEYCHSEYGECSAHKACTIGEEVTESCQCGSNTCHVKAHEGPEVCTKFEKEATLDSDEWKCINHKVYADVNTAYAVALALPNVIFLAMIASCLYFTWWFKTLHSKAKSM